MPLDPTLMLILLSAILHQIASTTCFVRSTSFIRREVLQIIPGGLKDIYCQSVCMNDISCTAIQMTSTGNCVIFGQEITATYGQCSAPFTCLLKTTTGCVPKSRRPIDLGYIANYCTFPVLGAPSEDRNHLHPCGNDNELAPGSRHIHIEKPHRPATLPFRRFKRRWSDLRGRGQVLPHDAAPSARVKRDIEQNQWLALTQYVIAPSDSGDCGTRLSVICDGTEHTMSLQDCENGYEFFYCAKKAIHNQFTGDWIAKNVVFSTHFPMEDSTCIEIRKTDSEWCFRRRMMTDVQDMLRICDQKKTKAPNTREILASAPDRVEVERDIYGSEQRTFRKEEELKRQIEDLYSQTTQNRHYFIGTLIVFIVAIVIAYRKLKKHTARLGFYNSGLRLINDGDDKV